MELALAVNVTVIVLLAVSNLACHRRQNRLFKRSLDAHAQLKSVADKYVSLANNYEIASSMIEALHDAWGIRSALAR
jgi:hypothetical protein